MLKKKNEKFDQGKYMQQWKKENMLSVKVAYKKGFVLEFREACTKLGIKQSEVIRNAMQETIDQAKEIAE